MQHARDAILKEVLGDFQRRSLAAADLQRAYKGFATTTLKKNCLQSGVNEVDFDLAFKELEEESLIGTGPIELAAPQGHGGVLIVPFAYSKREFVFLKEKGYKVASKPVSTRSLRSNSSTVIHGDQNINYGSTGAIGRHSTGSINQQQWAALATQVDLSQLLGELHTLKNELMKTAKTPTDFQRLGLVAEAEQYADNQDGPKVMEVLAKSGKWLFDFATKVGTDVAAKLIATAIGMEP